MVKEELEILRKGMLECNKCVWACKRTRVVTFVGPHNAEVAIVGRNPGGVEDSNGVPFCGPGGSYLNHFLEWIGLPRELCYITNAAHCYGGPGDPAPIEEVYQNCSSTWTLRELEILNPKVIITLGNDAMHHVAGKEGSCIPEEGEMWKAKPDGPVFLCITHPGFWLRQRRHLLKLRKEIVPLVRRNLKNLGIQGLFTPEQDDILELLRKAGD